MKINHRNPWSPKRLSSLPILNFKIGVEPASAIELGPERHLTEKIKAYLDKVHRHIIERRLNRPR